LGYNATLIQLLSQFKNQVELLIIQHSPPVGNGEKENRIFEQEELPNGAVTDPDGTKKEIGELPKEMKRSLDIVSVPQGKLAKRETRPFLPPVILTPSTAH
jgi:hypothetical protein